MQVNARDIAAGVIFAAIGLFFATNSLLYLRLGRALSMGPGYFPLLLGLVLTAFGVVIALQAIGKPAEGIGPVPWRGLTLVMAAMVFFAATVRGLGMGPAIFVSTLMAAQSSGQLGWRGSLILSAILSVFSVGIFIHLLNLPYPALGSWLGR